jgi:hypothetical protein
MSEANNALIRGTEEFAPARIQRFQKSEARRAELDIKSVNHTFVPCNLPESDLSSWAESSLIDYKCYSGSRQKRQDEAD